MPVASFDTIAADDFQVEGLIVAQHSKRAPFARALLPHFLVKLLARPNARKPTPLREILEEVILKYNFQIEEGGVRIDISADLPVADVDPEKMREVIGALIANAHTEIAVCGTVTAFTASRCPSP